MVNILLGLLILHCSTCQATDLAQKASHGGDNQKEERPAPLIFYHKPPQYVLKRGETGHLEMVPISETKKSKRNLNQDVKANSSLAPTQSTPKIADPIPLIEINPSPKKKLKFNIDVVVTKNNETYRAKTSNVASISSSSIQIIPTGNNLPPISKPNQEYCLSKECVWLAGQLLDRMDTNVDPCDDFEQFACGSFLLKEKASNYNDEIDSRLEASVKQQLEKEWKPANYPGYVNKAKKLYLQCTDAAQIARDNTKPLLRMLDKFGGLPMLTGRCDDKCKSFSWHKANAVARKLGLITTLFPNVEPIQLQSPYKYESSVGCGMWQPIDWAKEADAFVDLGVANASVNEEMEKVAAFGVKIQTLMHAFPEGNGTYMTVDELEEMCPDVPWYEYLNKLILVRKSQLRLGDKVHVGEVACVKAFCKMLKETSKEAQMNYFLAHVVYSFYHRVKIQGPRETVCLGQIHKAIPEALEYFYIKEIFDQSRRYLAARIGEEVRRSTDEMLRNSWFDKQTYVKVEEKIKNLILNVGYPKEFLEKKTQKDPFRDLKLTSTNFFVNINRALKVKFDNRFKDANANKSRDDISNFEGLLVDGAHYVHHKNALFLTARHLENKFFNKDYPDYINFASMGSTFGHEMVHAFDENGRMFDKDGALQGNLWTDASLQEFKSRARCFVDQYSQYSFADLPNVTINGERCLNENIADNIGFVVGYKAYLEHLRKNPMSSPLLPGLPYTQRQLYWITLANQSCKRHSKNDRMFQLLVNLHSPQRFRIVGAVSNSEDFARDFNCRQKDKMNPEKKCKLFS